MDLGEQADMNPNQSFRTDGQPQFQSQYPYPQSTSAFSIDQEMNMGNENFVATVQDHRGASIDNSSRHGSGQGSTNLNVTSGSAPGMPPPQGSGQPYSPGGARPSIDESQDGALSGGDSKRKRSKVSRACDECRRKKVRCDAVGEDGSIKTCANCARAGLTCDYSRIPMKRGPSKGYIKELSERVQQVESLQMALSNTPGYRQSLDATSYAEPYSPDDPMSLKRNFSFSADQRSPFVAPEFQRDRMPSIGWNSASPHSAPFRARDRGSIAIAPDQQPSNPISFAKPFWAQEIDESPPAKRQKMGTEDMEKPELGQEFLNNYYHNFHTGLPILPDMDATIAIVEKASPKVQHAFTMAVRGLPSSGTALQHGDTTSRIKAGSSSIVFKSREQLDDFMWQAAREDPKSRSAEDNALYLWSYLLMAVEAENDVARFRDGLLPKTILIKQAVDLGWNCVTAAAAISKIPSDINSKSESPYLLELSRAWHCASILARLHAFGVGSRNPIPQYYHQYERMNVPDTSEVLTPTGLIAVRTANQLTILSHIVQCDLPVSQWGENIDLQYRWLIQDYFDGTIAGAPQKLGNEVFLKHLRYFLDLIMSRFTLYFHPMDIVNAAGRLATELKEHLTATRDSFAYNPFDVHFFTLSTITMLEFLSEPQDTELFRVGKTGVEDIRNALEQRAERNHIEDNQENGVNGPNGSDVVRKAVHWSDALLKMIEERQKVTNATNTNGPAPARPTGLGDGTAAATDFSLLLKHGYLNVLANQVG